MCFNRLGDFSGVKVIDSFERFDHFSACFKICDAKKLQIFKLLLSGKSLRAFNTMNNFQVGSIMRIWKLRSSHFLSPLIVWIKFVHYTIIEFNWKQKAFMSFTKICSHCPYLPTSDRPEVRKRPPAGAGAPAMSTSGSGGTL